MKQLVKLSERREAHLAQIQKIDREISRVEKQFGIPLRETGDPATISFSGYAMPRARAERGALKKIGTAGKRSGSR